MVTSALVLIPALYIAATHKNAPTRPSDFRDAVADNNGFDTSLPVIEKDVGNIPQPKAVPVAGVTKGYVANPPAGEPSQPVEFVTIPGGKFMMGTDDRTEDFDDAKPVHEVTIKTFEMSKTDVTVEQYAECVIKGACTPPGTGAYCNWDKPDRGNHPVNCVSWDQAQQYAKFKGARLPTEAEWEYAATSGGKNQKYPWGNAAPTSELAVMGRLGTTMPVCSKPAGNTAQGLCDMSGNVWQWVQDVYKDSYAGAPTDGSAVEGEIPRRVLRGGSFDNQKANFLRADVRNAYDPDQRDARVGFRLAR